MRRPFPLRPLIVAAALGVVAIVVARSSLVARPFPAGPVAGAAVGHFGGFGLMPEKPEDPPPGRVFISQPVSPLAARVWEKLGQPVTMPFASETPLDDVLKYVRTATEGEDLPSGIPLYVDPAGLMEAERTLQSPITLQLEGIPLSTSLELALKQLDLAYYVRPDGLVVIAYIHSRELGGDRIEILNELEGLRAEIKALRREVGELKGAMTAHPPEPPAPAPHVEGGFQ